MKKTQKQKAASYLQNRYEKICLSFPSTRRDVPLKTYIGANMKYVLRYKLAEVK